MRRLVLYLIIMIELILCVILCMKSNIHKYEEWTEINGMISHIMITGENQSFRSSEPTVYTVSIDFQNISNILRFKNYHFDYKEGDEIIIKYNPDNPKEFIYLPYEKHRVLKERIRIVFVFVGIILISLYIWNSKCNDEPKHYWFDDVKKY